VLVELNIPRSSIGGICLSVLLRLGILLPVVEFQVAVSHKVEIDEQQQATAAEEESNTAKSLACTAHSSTQHTAPPAQTALEKSRNEGGMFQPQPTPYSSFSSYGVASALPDFPSFQPAAGLVVDSGSSGGPPVFRDPIFSPVASSVTADRTLNFHAHNNSTGQYKMAAADLEAQEALARNFQPALEVCGASKVKSDQH
jgi:hypothetical protein